MSRHRRGDKKPKKASLSEPSQPPLFSWWGKRLMWGGVFLALLGFWVLSWCDPLGRNWASWVSPILILGGYFLLALGLVWPYLFPSF